MTDGLAGRYLGKAAAWMLVLSAWAAPAARAQQPVDAAMKKLMAANGFFQRGLFKPAGREFADFLANYPAHPEATTARYGLAICHYRLNEYVEAANLCQEVLRDAKFKQRDEALAVLGHCRLSTKAYDKALAAFEELLGKHPASKHLELAAVNRAQTLYLLGKKAESLAACQAFIKKYPTSGRRAAAGYFLALSQAGLDKHADAAATLAQLLKDFPNSPYELDATLLLGQCMEGLKKLDEAAGHYRKFLKSAPADRQAEGHYSLGVVLYKANKHAEAMKELSAVLAGKAKGRYAAPARLQLGLAQLAAGQVAPARATLAQVVKTDPARAGTAQYWLAQADMAQKKYAPARAALTALAAAKPAPPNLPAILFDRAVCTMALGNHAAAAKEFEAFRKAYPKSPQAGEAAYRHAFCLHKLGKYPESLALCKSAGGSAAVKASAAELAAENLFLMGKYTEAQQAYAALAKQAKTEDAKLRSGFRLGQCAYFKGDYAGAITLLAPVAASKRAAGDEELRESVFLLGDAQLQAGRHAEAARSLAGYLAATKRNKEEAQFKLALAQLRGGQAPAAEKTLAALMAGPAGSPWVLRATFEYGQLTYRQKQPAKASPALAKVVAANAPEELTAPAMYLLGWIDFDAGRFAPAAGRFGQLVQKYPKNALAAEAAFQQAVCLQQAGQAKQALGLFQAYLKNHPKGPKAAQARHLAGTCLAKLGQHAEAVKVFAALSADKATSTEAVLYELAWSQRQAKQAKPAAATYRRLLSEHPKGKLATAARAELADLLYQEKDYPAAAELLAKVLADKAADAETLKTASYRLGWCHAKLKQHQQAAATFAGFAAKHPKDKLTPHALYQAGLAQALLKKNAEAQRHFAALLAAYPTHELAPVTQLKLGEVQNLAGDFKGAEATFQAFLSKHAKDPFAYLAQFGIGWSLQSRNKHTEARAWYAKVAGPHSGPTAARAQFQIGETYFAEGKFERAAEELIKVDIVYAYPEWSARALYEAGRAFEQLKKIDQAKQQYALCVKKYKDQPVTKLAEGRLKALTQAKS